MLLNASRLNLVFELNWIQCFILNFLIKCTCHFTYIQIKFCLHMFVTKIYLSLLYHSIVCAFLQCPRRDHLTGKNCHDCHNHCSKHQMSSSESCSCLRPAILRVRLWLFNSPADLFQGHWCMALWLPILHTHFIKSVMYICM